MGTSPPLTGLWRRSLGSNKNNFHPLVIRTFDCSSIPFTSSVRATRMVVLKAPRKNEGTLHITAARFEKSSFKSTTFKLANGAWNWLGLDSNTISSTPAVGSTTSPSKSGSEPPATLSVSDSPARLGGVRMHPPWRFQLLQNRHGTGPTPTFEPLPKTCWHCIGNMGGRPTL